MEFQKPVQGTLTDGYGPRGAVLGVPGTGDFHTGQDIAAPGGTPILPVAGGWVTRRWYEQAGGNMVEIAHGDGWTSRYAHMLQPSNKNIGDIVTLQSHIGMVGSTGMANGDHLHLELIKDGKFVDPLPYITAKNPQEPPRKESEMIVNIQGKAGVRKGGAYLLRDYAAAYLGPAIPGFPTIPDGEALRNLATGYVGISV